MSGYPTYRPLKSSGSSLIHRLVIESGVSGGGMKFSGPFTLVTLLFLSCSLSAAHTQNETLKQENVTSQTAPLKAINTPTAPYPEEARKKGIEGKVTLSIVVDANGNVSQAKALSGPEELVPAALASVKMWQFEPPSSAAVTKMVEVAYGFSKECPGPISDSGEVEWSWRLRDKNGKTIAVADDDDSPPPPYPEKERKSGVAGKMLLSITLNPDGHVREIHVVKSLSPVLDKAAIDTVRPLMFQRLDRNSDDSLEDLRLQFVFRATCSPHF
jgi:TonB family protein